MPSRGRVKIQGGVIPTSLEIFICSLVDRGLETAYDLQRHGGLSIGSTIPALTRMEAAGLVRKKIMASGNRTRHSYRLSAAGRRLARQGWVSMLEGETPEDIEGVLRVADLASHYETPREAIAAFLNRAADQKDRRAKQATAQKAQPFDGVAYLQTKDDLDAVRLRAESKFLRSYAKSIIKRRKDRSGKRLT